MNPLARNKVALAGNPTASRTLIFVNGLGTDQHCWQRVTPAFADDYRLVLFDNVGADAESQPYFLEHQVRYLGVRGYANDLLEICDALELDKDVTLVGHSLGALAALLACTTRPSLFRRLILIGASPRYANTEGYEGGFSSDDIKTIYREMSTNYAGWSKSLAAAAMGNPDRPSLANQFAEAIARIPQEMMLTILCSVLQTDQRAELAKLRIPTLLIQSQDDIFVPRTVADYLHAAIAGSELSVIDASGHLPHVSAPDQVVAAMSAFLSRG